MPIYYFRCPQCDDSTRRLLKPEQIDDFVLYCTKCGEKVERLSMGPSVRITETLDNGVMVRRLERLADAEQIHDEMAHGKKGNI